jgi:hypothetical protein
MGASASEELGAVFGKLIAYLAGGLILLYLAALAAVVAAIVAMIAIGVVSLLLVKSGSPVVNEPDPVRALGHALGWSSVVTVGCIIGSLGLLVLWTGTTTAGAADFRNRYGIAHDFMGYMLVLESWVLGQSYAFFGKTAAALYLANRVGVARSGGGRDWLGVIPPLFAMALFFVGEHWDLVSRFFTSFDGGAAQELRAKFVAMVRLPYDLAVRSIENPQYLSSWAIERLRASDGSFFKLASLYPTFFLIFAAAMLIKGLIAGGAIGAATE